MSNAAAAAAAADEEHEEAIKIAADFDAFEQKAGSKMSATRRRREAAKVSVWP